MKIYKKNKDPRPVKDYGKFCTSNNRQDKSLKRQVY